MDNNNINYYRIFHTVAATGSISQAAKLLYISQPAISKTIKKLEETLGTTLFYRTSRGVQLSESGKCLFTYTQKAFTALEEGEQSLKRLQQMDVGQIRIGVSTTLCKYILLPHLNEFINNYPHIKITIACQSTFHTVKLLEEGKIDIGLIGKPDPSHPLHFDSLRTIEDIFIAKESYLQTLKIQEHCHTTRDFFAKGNIMLLDEENITRHYINDYFRQNQITLNQILEINNMDLLIDFARTGLGIACVIKEFVDDLLMNHEIVQLPLQTPIQKRQIGYAYTKNAPITEAMGHFIHYYKSLC